MAEKSTLNRQAVKPNPVGRPTDYNQEMANKICDLVSFGKSLRYVSRQDDMPELVTIYRWLQRFPEFSKQYDKAKSEQIDTLADEIVDISDDISKDNIVNDDGKEVVNNTAVNRSRLMVDTRKWIAERMKPKKYGVRQEIEHSGKIDSDVKIDISGMDNTKLLDVIKQQTVNK